ncbi:MAG TPA: helix-turn-helix transcriptional regulator, partial [Chitinophagales bacterium]|nr:helix-turn-helix transcriptional regulator [Chitinophagales bacterium]
MEKHDYKKLKELREEKNITQKEMSTLLNMTQSNYSKLENGKKKMDSLQTLENLAKVLGIVR